uniref:Cornifelin n=1 Tax=Neogobius melanostomus TaxID=47308 RepID=A0A8C6U8F7_9GOBI
MQPPMAQVQPGPSQVEEVEWNTALLDCFEDPGTCCYGFWCGPCLACTVSGRMKECYCLPLCDYCTTSAMALCGLPFAVPPAAYGMRVALRHKYKIKGSLLNDLCVSCCCTWCSWCQMHRELKLRNPKPTVISIQNVSTLHL